MSTTCRPLARRTAATACALVLAAVGLSATIASGWIGISRHRKQKLKTAG